MSKDEKILCIPRDDLFLRFNYFNGFMSTNISNFDDRNFSTRDYLPRGEAETDLNWKQIIVYAIILNKTEDKVFGYIRQGSEQRLSGKWSFGFGGHMNYDDYQFNGGSIRVALNRELGEELEYNRSSMLEEVGYINLENNPVNAVHFGVVFKVITDGDVTLKGDENKSGMWLDANELAELKFEDWSEIVKPVVIGWLSGKK